MNALREYIRRAVRDVCDGTRSLPMTGNDLIPNINRSIATAVLNWQAYTAVPSPRDLLSVIAWEVNEYLGSKIANGSASKATAIAAAKKITGMLQVTSINPKMATLLNGKSVVYENTRQVYINKWYTYRLRGSVYHIDGDENAWVQKPSFIQPSGSFIWGQSGTSIYRVNPDPLRPESQTTQKTQYSVPNTFAVQLADGPVATIEDRVYNEYTSVPTDADPTATIKSKTIDLSSYFNDDGTRWQHTHPGKLVECQGFVILILIRIKDMPSTVPDNYPTNGTRTYSWHRGTTYVAYDLLIIDRATDTVTSYVQPFSTLPLQISHTGYIDVLSDARTGQLLVAFATPIPVVSKLDVADTQLRISKLDPCFRSSPANDVLLRSQLDIHRLFEGADDPHATSAPQGFVLERSGTTRQFQFGGHNLYVYRCDIDPTGPSLKIVETLASQSGGITELYGLNVSGGFTSAVLSQDPANGDVYLMRGYEAYLQCPVQPSETLLPGRDSYGALLLSATYAQGVYPGDVVAFNGNKFYNLTYKASASDFPSVKEIADLPGDACVQMSSLQLDPPGTITLNHGILSSYFVYRAVNPVPDTVSEYLRTMDVSGIFLGGTNDGDCFLAATTNQMSFLFGANIYIDKTRFGVIRDLSQVENKQVRLIVSGLRIQPDPSAKDLHLVDASWNATQGLFMLMPAIYNPNSTKTLLGPGSLQVDLYTYRDANSGQVITPTRVDELLHSFTPRAVAASSSPVQWLYITQLLLLKIDFTVLSPDTWLMVADLQLQNGWTGYRPLPQYGVNAGYLVAGPGEAFIAPYMECWKLVANTLKGWDKSLETAATRSRQVVGQIAL